MKTIIIGGGIGGLATYHTFRKYLPSATVDLICGGIGLGPNGQCAMAVIAPVLSFIRERAFEYSTIIFRSEAGKVLGEIPFGSEERYKYGQLMTTCSTVHMKVSRTWETNDGAYVEFEDGIVEKCDLLMGADGARSVTRNAISGEEYAPKYDGLIGFGGFVPLLELTRSTREQIKDAVPSLFTPLGSSEPRLLSFSHAEIENPFPRDTPCIDLMPLLMQRHGSWKSQYGNLSDPKMTLFRQIITRDKRNLRK